jgi:hypothetical protein
MRSGEVERAARIANGLGVLDRDYAKAERLM